MFDLHATLAALAAVEPDAIAIEQPDQAFSWRSFQSTTDGIGGLLDRAGLPQGARVGVLLRNRVSQVAALVAVIASARCVVTLNPLLPDDRLAGDVAALDLPLIIGEASDLARAGIDGIDAAVIELAPELGAARLVPGHERAPPVASDQLWPDVAVEMLTSGTTGTPKRVPLARRAFDTSMTAALSYESGRGDDAGPRLRTGVTVVNSPTTHIGGVYGVLTGLLSGRRVYLLEKFTVDGWRTAVVRHRPRVVGAVPAALRMILDADLPREDLASLSAITSGTAPLDPAIADSFLERYDIPVLQNYGATEFAGAIAGWSLADFRQFWHEKRGSVGRVHGNVEARVVDFRSGLALASGEEGILELRSEQVGSADDWLRTSDRAALDADNFLYIRGRADNAIIRGGFKVDPDEVVGVLHSHPAVREAAVVGIPDIRLGAVPVVAIVLRDGAAPPSRDEWRDFARARLLPYQVPVEFRILDDLPRTPSLKPSMPLLRELFTASAA